MHFCSFTKNIKACFPEPQEQGIVSSPAVSSLSAGMLTKNPLLAFSYRAILLLVFLVVVHCFSVVSATSFHTQPVPQYHNPRVFIFILQ